MPTAGKEIGNSSNRSLVHDTTLVHENQMIKGLKYLTGRLVDCEKNTRSGICDFFQDLTQLNRRKTVEPTRQGEVTHVDRFEEKYAYT